MKSSWDFSIGGLRLCPLSGQRTSLLPVAPTSEQMLQLEKGWMWADNWWLYHFPFLIFLPSLSWRKREAIDSLDSSEIWKSNLQCFPGSALTLDIFPVFPGCFPLDTAGNVSARATFSGADSWRSQILVEVDGGCVFQTFSNICFDPLLVSGCLMIFMVPHQLSWGIDSTKTCDRCRKLIKGSDFPTSTAPAWRIGIAVPMPPQSLQVLACFTAVRKDSHELRDSTTELLWPMWHLWKPENWMTGIWRLHTPVVASA